MAFNTASTESFLISARAALRKQNPPVEAPINPINAPPSRTSIKAQMTGRPSVNLPSEKMGAFLTEVKSAKLKKVSGSMAPPLSSDSARTALARSLSGTAKGKELLRDMERRKSITDLDAQAGQKRKRSLTDTDTVAEPGEYTCYLILDDAHLSLNSKCPETCCHGDFFDVVRHQHCVCIVLIQFFQQRDVLTGQPYMAITIYHRH